MLPSSRHSSRARASHRRRPRLSCSAAATSWVVMKHRVPEAGDAGQGAPSGVACQLLLFQDGKPAPLDVTRAGRNRGRHQILLPTSSHEAERRAMDTCRVPVEYLWRTLCRLHRFDTRYSPIVTTADASASLLGWLLDHRDHAISVEAKSLPANTTLPPCLAFPLSPLHPRPASPLRGGETRAYKEAFRLLSLSLLRLLYQGLLLRTL